MQPSMLERLLLLYARRFPIRHGKLRVVNALWRTAAVNCGTLRTADLARSRFSMPCDLNEMLQRQCYFFGTYFVEEYILACWENEARGAKVVFDIGANAGIYSLAALAVQPDAMVHAFEPTPEIAIRLREAAKLNGLERQLNVHEVAVSSRSGQATLRRYRGDLGTNEGMNFITTDGDENATERVVTIDLDGFCANRAIEHIDLLKIDIQGHEHEAFAGAAQLLNTGRIGTIFTELNWAAEASGDCSATQSVRTLEQAGYRFSKPGRRLEWQKSGSWMRTLDDIVARRVRC